MPSSLGEVVLAHLDTAFNDARWLTKNETDAGDVMQAASVRALRFFSSFRGEDARAWLFTVVRNIWSYKEIAAIVGIPVGTVMSRLGRRAAGGVLAMND